MITFFCGTKILGSIRTLFVFSRLRSLGKHTSFETTVSFKVHLLTSFSFVFLSLRIELSPVAKKNYCLISSDTWSSIKEFFPFFRSALLNWLCQFPKKSFWDFSNEFFVNFLFVWLKKLKITWLCLFSYLIGGVCFTVSGCILYSIERGQALNLRSPALGFSKKKEKMTLATLW